MIALARRANGAVVTSTASQWVFPREPNSRERTAWKVDRCAGLLTLTRDSNTVRYVESHYQSDDRG